MIRTLAAAAITLALIPMAQARPGNGHSPQLKRHAEVTDVSSARRHSHIRGHRFHHGSLGARRLAGHAIGDSLRPRSAGGMDIAGADRDGRWGASAERAREAAPSRPAARWAARRSGARHSGAVRQIVTGGQARFGATLAVEHSRPRDCFGIQWCGCWLRHAFGIGDRSLNLAIAWARVGAPASPDNANVVVWRHHVGKLLAHDNGRILVQSGNDGGAVRTRWLSPRILGGVVAYRKV